MYRQMVIALACALALAAGLARHAGVAHSLFFPAEHRWESRAIRPGDGGERRLPVPVQYGGEISPDGRQVVETGIEGWRLVRFVLAADDSTGATRRQLTYFDAS
jgi:hypothetical protein